MTRYEKVLTILDAAINNAAHIGAHGAFWRGLTRDQFVAKSVFGKKLIELGDPDASNLIHALEGTFPFGRDLGVQGAMYNRMPDRLPAVASADIQFIRAWIQDGCPEADAMWHSPLEQDNAFWREFDNWAMFQADPETQAAEGAFMGRVDLYTQWALGQGPESAWIEALAQPDVAAGAALLADKIAATVTKYYGSPANQDRLLESFGRFGGNLLGDDPLRPGDPHTMNGETMWFFFFAMVDFNLRQASQSVPDLWVPIGRGVLLGYLADGLMRLRYRVEGFTAGSDLVVQMTAFVAPLSAEELRREYVKRIPESGLITI